MADYKTSSNFRNFPYPGKQAVRPPKSPFPSISPSYADYGSSTAVGSKATPKPREGNRHHQRTSSESFLIEEQPSWLDELLNEPETPVRRAGHRRSSSDSFAYLDSVQASNVDNIFQEHKFKSAASTPSWSPQEFEYNKKLQHGFYQEPNSFQRQQNRSRERHVNSMAYSGSLASARGNGIHQNLGMSCPKEPDGVSSAATEKQDQDDHGFKGSSDRRDCSYSKSPASETDPKRVKQQHAQRSRVRKLQYIAELEKNIQAMEAEGSEVLAEIKFLDKRNLVLSMENKTLKQRLDSLAQEKLIKYTHLSLKEGNATTLIKVEQEMLEKEIARLKALYQQQQLPQQLPPSTHRRTSSRDLDSQFANLSLKHEPTSTRDREGNPLRI